MNSKDIIYLLRGGHYNMEERLQKKIWPHEPLLFRNLIYEVAMILRKEKVFPHHWVKKENGELIDDVVVIEMIEKDKFIYKSRVANQSNLLCIGEQSERVFNSAEEAAESYLRSALNLPGDLDGWKVIDNR